MDPIQKQQNQFRFSLLGSHIELCSNTDLAYMEKVFRHLEQKIATTQEALKLNDALKTAIITAFLLVDDLLMECSGRERLEGEELEVENCFKNILQELKELLQREE